AMVHGIVKQAEGHIAVRSEPDAGTTFRLYFPRAEQLSEAGQAQAQERPHPRGTETVLLVEDEPGVRALSLHALSACGYTVLEASNGSEALQAAKAYRGTIHVLVTDVIMPTLGGRQLAERLRALHPEAKVLYLSGYTD